MWTYSSSTSTGRSRVERQGSPFG